MSTPLAFVAACVAAAIFVPGPAAMAQGAPLAQPGGPMLTFGGAPTAEGAGYAASNPARASLSQGRFGMGILSNIGAGFAIGKADDFDRDIDRIFDDFDALESRLLTFTSAPDIEDIQALIADLNSFEADANRIVEDLTDDGHVRLDLAASGPGAPLSLRAAVLRGVVTLDYDGFVEARAWVDASDDAFTFGLQDVQVDDPERFSVGQTEDGTPVLLIDGEEASSFEASETAGVAVQGGLVGRVGIGYARELWENGSGGLHGGAAVNVYRVTLARAGRLFDDEDASIDDAGETFEDNQSSAMGVGLDVGVMWHSERYAAGATLKNINAPSFDYPDACNGGDEVSCDFFEANPQARRNGASWTMDRQLTFEGAVFTPDRRWNAGLRLDANSASDSTGDAYQWLAASAGYRPSNALLPRPRVGMRRNLAGEELTYVSLGVTLFRAVHVDVSRSLETASFDGNKLPRALQLNLSVSFQL